MFATVLPVLVALGVLGIFSLGALFGAWVVESDKKKRATAEPLMEVVYDSAG